MISMVLPIPVGNALRLFLEPPVNAVEWRILRKGSDSFSGHDDATALVAYEGTERSVVDSASLQNEVAAFYKPYYYVNDAWVEGATATGTPVASYKDFSTDAHTVVRDRLEAGLRVEVARGNFIAEMGYIQVYTAPPSLERDLRLPLVSVHLTNERPTVRSIGEDIGTDQFDELGGEWMESEGWLADVEITIIGWCLNPDERIDLRKALRRIVVANLPIFASHGMEHIDFNQQDVDAVNGEYGPPVYQAVCSFTCLAPIRVGQGVDAISDVEVRSNDD